MNEPEVAVFFYGLFMDETLLASTGIRPSHTAIGYVDGYRLRIGKRATLETEADGRVHGICMTMKRDDLARLYSEDSVADYVPVEVSVRLAGEANEPAVCYVLPAGKVAGTNSAYAESLLQLATRLGFPGDYLAEIKAQVEHG